MATLTSPELLVVYQFVRHFPNFHVLGVVTGGWSNRMQRMRRWAWEVYGGLAVSGFGFARMHNFRIVRLYLKAAFDLSIVYSGGDESEVPVSAQPTAASEITAQREFPVYALQRQHQRVSRLHGAPARPMCLRSFLQRPIPVQEAGPVQQAVAGLSRRHGRRQFL